jgi:hypothetical protein
MVGVGLLLAPSVGSGQSALPWVFHSAATAVANGLEMPADYFSTVVVQVEGTFVGTVIFEKKTAGASGYVAFQCTNVTTGDRAIETTEPSYWECPGAASRVRARISTYTSGTIIVTGHGTTAVSSRGGIGGFGSTWASLVASGAMNTSESTTFNIFGQGAQSASGRRMFQHSNGTFIDVCVVAGVENDCNYIRQLAAGKNIEFKDSTSASIALFDSTAVTFGKQIVTAASGIQFTESDTNPTCASGNYTLYADTSETKLKTCVNGRASDLVRFSAWLGLNPRGAATLALESVATNHPTGYYLTVTDANTDAVDFELLVQPNSPLIGSTTATMQLIGLSKNASPSGNIDFDCAITSSTPGTDTFAAHSTTGEVTALLTPSTQYRPVAVTTSAHTINGGALASGDIIRGSCEVDATATTSAQMADFRLWGWVLVTFN